MTRTRNAPDADGLRLGRPVGGDTVDEDLRDTLGDPAYLHEMGPAVNRWSRKQIEKGVKRLAASGKVAVYGRGTRRLYATPRRIPEELAPLPARAIRLLQLLPLDAMVTLELLREVARDVNLTIGTLAEAGLAERSATSPISVRLTAKGRRIARTLGNGIRLTDERADLLTELRWPDDERARTLFDPSLRDVPIPRTDDHVEQGWLRRAFSWNITATMDRHLEEEGRTVSELQTAADAWLAERGVTPSKLWVSNIHHAYRLPSEEETAALAWAIGIDPSRIDTHIRRAPWLIEERFRAWRATSGDG